MSEPGKYPTADTSGDFLEDADGLVPADAIDPLIEAFKKDVDRTLLRANLKLTPQQRSEKFLAFMKGVYELRGKANPDLKVWR
jgi:hypothetical protein